MRRKVNKWVLLPKTISAPLEFGIVTKEKFYHKYKAGQLVRIESKDLDDTYKCCSFDNVTQFIGKEDLQRL